MYPGLLPGRPATTRHILVRPVPLGSEPGSTLLATWVELLGLPTQVIFWGPIRTTAQPGASGVKGVFDVVQPGILGLTECKMITPPPLSQHIFSHTGRKGCSCIPSYPRLHLLCFWRQALATENVSEQRESYKVLCIHTTDLRKMRERHVHFKQISGYNLLADLGGFARLRYLFQKKAG